jgi:hypothetical protein
MVARLGPMLKLWRRAQSQKGAVAAVSSPDAAAFASLMRRFVLWLAAVLLLPMASGCTTAIPEPPKVASAPPELAGLRVHVANATSVRAEQAGERSVTGYTLLVRGAVQDALERAGYVLVVDPDQPYDLEALVHTDYLMSMERVGGTLLTSVTLQSPEQPDAAGCPCETIEQLAGRVEVDENADIDPSGAVELVERMGRSPRLEAFARTIGVRTPAGLVLIEGEPVPAAPRVRSREL